MAPLAIAHRGDPMAFRENTIDACLAAVRAGADMVEIDIARTADGSVVLLHDATLERLWGVPRAVGEMTLAEVCAVGHGDCRIPELRELLQAVEAPLMVDYTELDVVEPALEVLAAADAFGRVLFSGENVAGHRRIRELAPEARIALTWTAEGVRPDELLDELQVEFWNPCWELVELEAVESMHERGVSVSTWTIDSPAEMARLLDLGVDAVITNEIAALVRVLARSTAEGSVC
jgi:glycerophosphoryl diester phosphodiesterase